MIWRASKSMVYIKNIKKLTTSTGGNGSNMTSSSISTRYDAIYWSGSWLQSVLTYYQNLDILLTERGCYRELSS
jgi:hypothetical protein